MNKLERKDLLIRRKAVLKEVENNSIILIYGSKNIIKTNEIEYDFRQDSDFLYLIGIKESNLVSLILKKDNKSKVILFRDESSEFEKQWIGTKKSNSLIFKPFNLVPKAVPRNIKAIFINASGNLALIISKV